MSSESVHAYLPHRRQRPLSDTTYEYAILEHSGKPDFSSNLGVGNRLMAISFGILAAVSTVGLGTLGLMSGFQPTNSPQVAGIYTEASADDYTTSPTNTPEFVPSVCWNQVQNEQGILQWPNSCRGLAPSEHVICDPTQSPLTVSEIRGYQMWFENDQVLPVECRADSSQVPIHNPFSP